MYHLIADSGIHFITHEIEFNPSEPLLLNNGKTLKNSFVKIRRNNRTSLIVRPMLRPSR